jgi:thiol-disulfide isomerase/thioredoxin
VSRRGLLIAGAVATGAGLGAALWRERRVAADEAQPSSGQAAAEPDPSSLFWSLRFPKPGGGEVVMASFRGRTLLVNFWATWCPPCVREMPEIDRFAREFAGIGWQVLGLAADQDKPVREFLGRQPVSYPIALAGFDGIALGRSLGNQSGALPFTVAFDAAGRIVHRHLGETTFEQLKAVVLPR